MELSNLETLFDEARKLSGHAEYVVVGSLSALGMVRAIRCFAAKQMSSSPLIRQTTPTAPGNTAILCRLPAAWECPAGMMVAPH